MKINTATRTFAIGLAFTCGLLMSTGLANAATVTATTRLTQLIANLPSLRRLQLLHASDSGGGANDINGDPSQDVIFAQGYQIIDKDPNLGETATPPDIKGLFPDALTITGAGTNSGTFSLTLPLVSLTLFLFLESGNNLDPVWVAFALIDGITSGSWSINFNSLSHATLYAKVDPTYVPPGEVPLPAGLVLLFSALGGLGFLSRFRKAGAAA